MHALRRAYRIAFGEELNAYIEQIMLEAIARYNEQYAKVYSRLKAEFDEKADPNWVWVSPNAMMATVEMWAEQAQFYSEDLLRDGRLTPEEWDFLEKWVI